MNEAAVREQLLAERDRLRGPAPESLEEAARRRRTAPQGDPAVTPPPPRSEHEVRRLRQIESALKRLDRSEYGYCEACGEPIEADRLASDLAALRCSRCG